MSTSSSVSCSSTSYPPRPPPRLRLFHLHFRLAPPSTSALPTLPTRRQALRQLPSSVCWTSTCELPSSVCTAGPQPASCPAQCAPLDLIRGPAQVSVHRWTSTGPQRTDRMPENMLDGMSDRMPEDIPDKMPWNMPDRMSKGMSNRISNNISDKIPQDIPDRIPENLPDNRRKFRSQTSDNMHRWKAN